MSGHFTFLTDDELEHLDNFLLNRIDDDVDTRGKNEGVLVISDLDGLFAAIVSGPVIIQPSQWLPVVWGDYEPVWENKKDFEAILSLMMRHMNSIAAFFSEQPENFEPMFMEHKVENKTFTIVDEWCEGYRRGVKLTQDSWETGGEHMAALLSPIYAFTTEEKWPGHDLDTDKLENLQQSIAPNAREIYAYWLARREKFSPAVEPVRRSEPRIGRNDPCPCGSGKKYKKCCLH